MIGTKCDAEHARYVEIRPCPPLRPFVRRIWSLTVPRGRSVAARSLPCGGTDVLYELGEPASVDGEAQARARDRLVGVERTGRTYRFPGGTDLVGVSFHPGAARPFFGCPLDELTDGQCDSVVIPEARLLMASEELAAIRTFLDRVRHLERVLRARCAMMQSPDRAIAAVVAALEARRRPLSSRRLSEISNLGERSLERRFRSEVGVSPTAFAGIMRFVAASKGLASEPDVPRVSLALQLGYYDQAHFNREFKRHAGVSPSAWLVERERVGIVQYSADALAAE